ncbi:MAG: hypothetical protein GX620_13680 [Chloroflexi bacterium]|nr:hypothetical protein [Chloroflexota bacterium]
MRFISSQDLHNWLDQLAQEAKLIAPVEMTVADRPGAAAPTPDGMRARFAAVSGADEIAWGYQRTAVSAREFLVPRTETLFTIETDTSGNKTLKEPVIAEAQVIFGIRPCDARAFRVLDAVMLEQEPVDTYYAQRRQNTTLVGLSCPAMWDSCFCTSVGGAPNAREDVDILLTAVEGGYAVDVVTDKGSTLAQTMTTADSEDMQLPEPELSESFAVPTIEQWLEKFDEVYWDRVGDRCLSCRACVYVCPTCRCFDVREETIKQPDGTLITRSIRTWDSCQGANYRVVAGGANPRAQVGQRTRNRMYCKFYYVPTDYQVEVACVGCGRCITACPVNIDISEVLQDVARREEA